MTQLNIWIRYILPLFIGFMIGALVFLLGQFREGPGLAWQGAVWFFGTIFIIWELGFWISNKLEKKWPWRGKFLHRLSLQLLLTNLLGTLVFIITFTILNWYENEFANKINPLAWIHLVVVSIQAFVIIQLFNSVQITYQLLSSAQQLELQAEQYKKESIQAKLNSIKQQIDPHFLFNNFNTLEGLIHESPPKASLYLQQLSALYRKVLDHLELENVSVSEELELLQHYTDLLKIRHGDSFQIEINIPEEKRSLKVVPFALQLLVENALKHNIALPEKPLLISISMPSDESLEVRNNLQKRTSMLHSKGLGLKNLSARCEHQMRKQLEIKQNRREFWVNVPLKT